MANKDDQADSTESSVVAMTDGSSHVGAEATKDEKSDGVTATTSDTVSEVKEDNLRNEDQLQAVPLGPIALPYPMWSTPVDHDSDRGKHIRDSSALQGSCGLYNIGNICFMNAGLQCLLANSNFMRYFLEIYQVPENCDSLTAKFAELCSMVWTSNYVQIHPQFFKDILGAYHPQFQNYRQHDCQEFLALILDDLHEELNVAKLNVRANVYAGYVEKSVQKDTAVECGDHEETGQDLLEAAANRSDITDISNQSSSVTPVETQSISEDSNQSADVMRFKALPQNVQGFKSGDLAKSLCSEAEVMGAFSSFLHKGEEENVDTGSVNINTQCSGLTPVPDGREQIDSFKFERNFTSLPSTSNQNLNIHSIEEFYMKETKTKNVNVLATEFMEEEIKTDSEKFPRQEVVATTSNSLADDMDIEIYEEAAKGDSKDPNSDINILPIERKDNDKVNGKCRKTLLKSTQDVDESSINNIKRIKIDEDQKNFKLEQLQKVNTDKNQCLSGGAHSVDVACCSAPASDTNTFCLSPGWQELMEKEANKEWDNYLERNWSIIVDTFQGQYRNMVVCSMCNHTSVTYEPFMYLTVPLPHAMEKQICVVVKYKMPRPSVKYMVTVNKGGNIGKLRQELMSLIKKETIEGELVFAEVYENHISRILEDQFLIRYLREMRTVYAFEMGTAAHTENDGDEKEVEMKTINTMKNDISTGCQIDGPMGTSLDDNDDDLFSFDDKHSDKADDDSDGPDMSPLFHDSDDEDARRAQNTNILLNNMTASASDTGVTGNYDIGFWNNDVSAATGSSVTDRLGCSRASESWKSCTICLEEMSDSDLMVHTSCGGTLCQSCLDMSIAHYGETAFACPVCSLTVDPAEEFAPLSSGYKPKIRILTIPVVFRYDYTEDGKTKPELFGHPSLQYMPNCMTGEQLLSILDQIVPFKAEYHVLLVDGQGLHCSRCLYHEHCKGCKVDMENDINILPGDHLALSFTQLTDDQRGIVDHITNDASLELLRPNHTLTLYDCLRAFTQSEVLDEQNPWFCPRCHINRRANKTISLWRYPDWVIIYLKRFVFHDLSSSKIDNKVAFPLEDLDLHDYLSGPVTKELLYDLKGCVCHFGGVNSGHYTAYTKHPVTDTWHYYNDETVTVQVPQEDDYRNAYILFYQRKGSGVDLDTTERRSTDGDILPGTLYLNDDTPVDAKLDFYS